MNDQGKDKRPWYSRIAEARFYSVTRFVALISLLVINSVAVLPSMLDFPAFEKLSFSNDERMVAYVIFLLFLVPGIMHFLLTFALNRRKKIDQNIGNTGAIPRRLRALGCAVGMYAGLAIIILFFGIGPGNADVQRTLLGIPMVAVIVASIVIPVRAFYLAEGIETGTMVLPEWLKRFFDETDWFDV